MSARPSPPPERRRAAVFAAAFLALSLAGCGSGEKASPADDDATLRITHGPILGRLGNDHIGVWVRTSKPGPFRVFYGTAPDQMLTSFPGETRQENDNSGWVQIDNLTSNTKYYYQVSTGPAPSPDDVEHSGHFHTLPSVPDVVDDVYNPDGLFNFAFEFGCGNNQMTGSGSPFQAELPTYRTMRRELIHDDRRNSVDFAILNGDWLYEEQRDLTAEQWAELHRSEAGRIPRVLEVMPSIAGVWANYKLYLERGKAMAEFHRYVPSYFTFDDHEILNDAYGAGEIGRRDRRAVFRDIGVEAWYDYLGWSNEVEKPQPIVFGRAEVKAGDDILTDNRARFSELKLSDAASLHVHWGTQDAGLLDGVSDTDGGDPNAGVYEVVEIVNDDQLRVRPPFRADGELSYSIGRRSYWRKRLGNAEFLFLDTRTFREMHDVRNRLADKSMLGQRQKDWLIYDMKASLADMFFVVSSVNLTIPHVGGTNDPGRPPENKDDAWTAFLKERNELIDFWSSLGKPVFVLTGDLHNSFAIQISPNVWELASGPHNSGNHPATSEGGRPPNGRYDSFGRPVDIRWSTYISPETPNELRNRVVYTVVQVNNVFRNDRPGERPVWVPYPRPQIVFQFHDGVTGDLLYAESIVTDRAPQRK